jgi:hypothetical protein
MLKYTMNQQVESKKDYTRKADLLVALDYLYQLPPSKWNVAIITGFKLKVLEPLMTFISAADDNNIHTKTEGVTSKDGEETFGL